MDIFFLAPIEATYVSQLNPNTNFGPCEKLFVGQSNEPTDIFRTLLKFDIRSIPQGCIISKATLRLFLNQDDSSLTNELYVNRLISNFSQNTVTWNNAPKFKYTLFNTDISDENINNYIYINITELVRGWYSKTIENNGILLSTLETITCKMEYFGFEDEVVSHCPSLLIEYTKMKEQNENTDITSDTDAITSYTNKTTDDSISINTSDISNNISPTNKANVTGISSTKDLNKPSFATSNADKNFNAKGPNGKKNTKKGPFNKKNNGNVANNKNNNTNVKAKNNYGKGATQAASAAAKGSIIPFASGGPIILTTVNSGLVGNTSLVGFGSAALDVPLLDGCINLVGSKLEPVLNFAFSVPRAGSITSIVAFFSNIVELNLVNSAVSITAQIFKSTGSEIIFNPIQETFLKLGPPLTGMVTLGAVSKGALSNLSIDVNVEDRLLLVFFATASGISLIHNITGYASAGLTIA